MTNFFESALHDLDGLEQKLLGPDYKYWDQIKNPEELGISGEGTLGQVVEDAAGVFAYMEALVTGGGNASKSGRPLGNKFFLQTGGTCSVKGSDKKASRNIYINNVPDGTIPFISSGLGVNMTTFEGIIPGLMGNAARINPLAIFQSFMQGSNPECIPVTMEVIDSNGISSQQTRYLATADVSGLSPCDFPDKKNPITGDNCVEAMSNMSPAEVDDGSFKLPEDAITQAYIAGLGALGLYILYKCLVKGKDMDRD